MRKLKFKIGDYVKIVDQDALEWIAAGIYGKINTKIFKIVGVDESEHYLLSDGKKEMDWFPVYQLELASDLEVSVDKYNL